MHRLYEIYTEIPYSSFWYALTLVYNDRLEEAYPIIDNLAKKDPGNVITKLGCMLKYGLQGNREKTFKEMIPNFQNTCQRHLSTTHSITTACTAKVGLWCFGQVLCIFESHSP